jgi:hypothetical protein
LEYTSASFISAPSYEDGPEESICFAMSQKLFPDFGFSWDVDFGSLKVPRSDANERSSDSGNGAKRSRQYRKDATSENISLRRSAWAINSKTNRQAGSLALRSDVVSSHSRDSLFAMLLANNPTPHRVPSFPSAELLNYMIETHFAVEDPKSESFIHRSSLDLVTTSLDLISAIVSNGATYISSPAIWHFGLALHELTSGMIKKLESSSVAARDMTLLQASMLHLETGQWSGFNRQTAAAEIAAPQLLISLRRTGRTSFTSDTNIHTPDTGDSPEILESKWRNFITIESCKRFFIRLLPSLMVY